MGALVWKKDGRDHVVRDDGKEVARLSPERGPLGLAFAVKVRGRRCGCCGGGDASSALKAAKSWAEGLITDGRAV